MEQYDGKVKEESKQDKSVNPIKEQEQEEDPQSKEKQK